MTPSGLAQLRFFSAFLFVGTAGLLSAPAYAAFITHDGSTRGETGTGIGNTLTVLILQNNGSEFGAVEFNGTGDDVSDDAQPASTTRTSAELMSEGINASNLAVILNVNETGANDEIELNDFIVRFYNSDASLSFDALFDSDDPNNSSVDALSVAGQGTGSSGYVFRIFFDGSEPFDFFGAADNRVGMLVTSEEAITGSTDGPENFYLLAVPEPAACTLGLVAGAIVSGRRRRLPRDQR